VQGILVLLRALADLGFDLRALALAWARLLPTLVLLPAFGARVLPTAARTVLGLGLAVAIVPALSSSQHAITDAKPLAIAFALEVLRGLPPALATSAILWAAMMGGGLMDDLRGSQPGSSSVFSEASTPIGTLLGLFVCFSFLELGGAEQLVATLADGDGVAHAGSALVIAERAVARLGSACGMAVALATPIVAAVMVWEVGAALIVRAANPAHVQAALSSVRALVVLGALGLSLEGILSLLDAMLAVG
jgi:type III secretory pathway component EscT